MCWFCCFLSACFDLPVSPNKTNIIIIIFQLFTIIHFIIRLRNPFRFALDPNAAEEGKTRFFINDVGRHTWESVHEGGDGFAGANYGYPEREGKLYRWTCVSLHIMPTIAF